MIALMTGFGSLLLLIALNLTVGLSVWLAAALNSVVEAFSSTAWTLVYRELAGLGLTGENASLVAGFCVARGHRYNSRDAGNAK